MIGFDDLSEVQDNGQKALETKPFWKVSNEGDKEVLEWLNCQFDSIKRSMTHRHTVIKENIAYYKGMAYQRQGSQSDREAKFNDSSCKSTLRKLRMSVNAIHDMIEQNVSRETRYRPAVTFNPGGESDHDDLMASKVVEKVNTGIWYREDIDSVVQQSSRVAKIAGESYTLIKWDKHKGPLHPDYVKKLFKTNGIKKNPDNLSEKEIDQIISEEIKKTPKITIVDQDGSKITVDKPVRIGEEEFVVELPLYILLQPKKRYQDCEWAFYFEYVNLEDLQADYPEKAQDLKASKGVTVYDVEELEEKTLYNHCLKIHFYHKSTSKLDSGRYICFTRDAILEEDDNKFAKFKPTNGFPWVRRFDILPPDHLHGVAVMEQAKPLQEKINWLYSALVRGSMLASQPKWVAPRNSVKAESMGNDTTIMWYSGAVPPRLEQPNPGAANNFRLIEIFTNEMQKIMGVFGVSRGEPPAGVKAGVALQFLDEQENERANSQVANLNSMIRTLAKLTVFNSSIYYDPSDDRLKKILGINDSRLAKYFDHAELSREWDVKAQTSSALPQQKGQRIQTIIDLKKEFPGKVDDDEALDMIGFGQADKFITINTANIRSAEAETDEILRTGNSPSPEKWEEHLTHYRIHIRKLSEFEMKDGTIPKSKVDGLKDHIAQTEMLMMQIMENSPSYAQLVYQRYPAFPLFMPESIASMMAPNPQMMGAEAMNPAEGMQQDMAETNPNSFNPPQEVPAGVENITPTEG